MNIQELVGKRALLKMSNGYGGEVQEFKIIETSPSGNWVKLQNIYGNKFWKAIIDVSLVEVLRDLEVRPTPREADKG